ncbi:MAPEG family protein [Oricola sp.]|uniref:MAPEG family protein n=1 Tax=Oricola sp. TaxID=1979950 RepID=UPI003BA8D81F
MQQSAIYWPMIAQVALTFAAYVIMSLRRIDAVKSGAAKARDFKIPDDPELSASAARNVSNQFELPVLFYVVCLALVQTGGVSVWTVGLAWLFVILRYAHAWVHMTSNRLGLRRPVFTAGYAVVGMMWIWLAARLVIGG